MTGGMVAQEWALSVPERVASLTLVDTSYGTRTTAFDAAATDAVSVVMLALPVSWQTSWFAGALAGDDVACARWWTPRWAPSPTDPTTTA